MPSSLGRAPNSVVCDGPPALGLLRPGTTPPPKGVAVVVGPALLPFAVVADTVCAVATVCGPTLLPFAIIADTACAVALAVADIACAVAPAVAGTGCAVVPGA